MRLGITIEIRPLENCPLDRVLEKECNPMKLWDRPDNIFVLDAEKAAFVIIDMQNFSCAPAIGAPLPP
jgi:hypothetical protein